MCNPTSKDKLQNVLLFPSEKKSGAPPLGCRLADLNRDVFITVIKSDNFFYR